MTNVCNVCMPHRREGQWFGREEFPAMLGEVVSGIDSGERFLVCRYLNRHACGV